MKHEVVCTCSLSQYDGDDGYNRDCPLHGYWATKDDAGEQLSDVPWQEDQRLDRELRKRP